MATNEETNAAGTDTRPPMLVENDYESWKIRIHRYIRGKPNGKLIWNSIQNGPTPHPMVTDPSPSDSTIMPAPRKKLDSEFNEEENKLEMADTQAEIILSQGLPRHIFNILNQTSTAKEIWDNVELLMQGSLGRAHGTTSARSFITLTPSPQPTKAFPPTNNQLRTSSTPKLMLRCKMCAVLLLEPIQRKAPVFFGNSTRARRLTKTNVWKIETLKNELLQCKQEICRLDTHKVKLDLENKVRQEQALVIQRNMRNAELVQENDLLKSTLSGKEKSIAFLQSEKEKILSKKKDLADSYLDEIVCLKNANKVAKI
ncbi:hypothetical protein Tco_1484347 [Tanacetum coccineum]